LKVAFTIGHAGQTSKSSNYQFGNDLKHEEFQFAQKHKIHAEHHNACLIKNGQNTRVVPFSSSQITSAAEKDVNPE
jgi:hypothetical protein